MERSVDLVVVRELSVLRGATSWRSLTGPVARFDGSDPVGAVLDLSVDGLVVRPDALFLRSLKRRPSELPREPAATGEPAVRLSVNDSVVLGDAEGTALLRCEDSRSNSEPRDALLLPETLGADVRGAGFGVLSAPIRPPIRLVPVRSGASIRCGGAYMRAVSMPGLGAIRSVARGVRSGCAGRLSIRWNIDPRPGALEIEGALAAGALLSARGLGDDRNDRDEFSDGADDRELNEGWNDRDGLDGADDRELNDGRNDRDEFREGADGRELNDGRSDRDEFREGADGRELNEPLRLDIRLVIELPRFPNDGLRATDRLGAGAALRDAGRDARAELAPRPRILPSADDPRSRIAPAAILTTATRAPRLFSPAVPIFVLLSFAGVILNESEIPSDPAAGFPPFRITRCKLVQVQRTRSLYKYTSDKGLRFCPGPSATRKPLLFSDQTCRLRAIPATLSHASSILP